eukprot:1502034-Amphidinium_carterae.1
MVAKLKRANEDKADNNRTQRYLQENVMALHGQYYKQLNTEAQQRLQDKANYVRAAKAQENAQELESCEVQLEQLLRSATEMAFTNRTGATKISHCKLRMELWGRVGELYAENM